MTRQPALILQLPFEPTSLSIPDTSNLDSYPGILNDLCQAGRRTAAVLLDPSLYILSPSQIVTRMFERFVKVKQIDLANDETFGGTIEPNRPALCVHNRVAWFHFVENVNHFFRSEISGSVGMDFDLLLIRIDLCEAGRNSPTLAPTTLGILLPTRIFFS